MRRLSPESAVEIIRVREPMTGPARPSDPVKSGVDCSSAIAMRMLAPEVFGAKQKIPVE